MKQTLSRFGTIGLSATIVKTGTVDGIMKQFTQPIADLDKLIADREAAINALFAQEEKLKQQIVASEQKRKAHVAEIQKARDAAKALRTVIG